MLQALCLTARSSFDVIEDWVEATLLLPDPRLSEAVCPHRMCAEQDALCALPGVHRARSL